MFIKGIVNDTNIKYCYRLVSSINNVNLDLLTIVLILN